MNPINGQCHCGNIQYQFIRPDFDPDADDTLSVRICTCSFCVKHGGIYTSHPKGTLTAQIANESLIQRYAFGTSTAHFYTCQQCGVFPFVTSEIAGSLYAVVNVNTFENIDKSALIPATADFEGENLESRLERRTRTWIPTVRIAS